MMMFVCITEVSSYNLCLSLPAPACAWLACPALCSTGAPWSQSQAARPVMQTICQPEQGRVTCLARAGCGHVTSQCAQARERVTSRECELRTECVRARQPGPDSCHSCDTDWPASAAAAAWARLPGPVCLGRTLPAGGVPGPAAASCEPVSGF